MKMAEKMDKNQFKNAIAEFQKYFKEMAGDSK